jgi:hypothetical protein
MARRDWQIRRGGGQSLWAHYFASHELVVRLKAIGATGWRFQECTVKADV